LEKPKREKQYFDEYLKKYPSDNSMRKEYTKLLFRMQNFQGAIIELIRIIPLEKNNTQLKKILAHCYMKSKKYDDAIPILKELLRGEPDSFDHIKSIIFCLEHTNNKDTAIRFIEKVREHSKDRESLSLMLGVLYFKAGMIEKAVTLFREAVSKEPNNWKAYQNLGIVYKKMGNNLFGDKFLKRAQEYKNKKANKPIT